MEVSHAVTWWLVASLGSLPPPPPLQPGQWRLPHFTVLLKRKCSQCRPPVCAPHHLTYPSDQVIVLFSASKKLLTPDRKTVSKTLFSVCKLFSLCKIHHTFSTRDLFLFSSSSILVFCPTRVHRSKSYRTHTRRKVRSLTLCTIFCPALSSDRHQRPRVAPQQVPHSAPDRSILL